MATTIPRPDYAPEMQAAVTAMGEALPSLTLDTLPAMRQGIPGVPTVEEVLAGRPLTHREATIRGYQGAEISISIIQRDDHHSLGPGVYHIHGGGMVLGDRFLGIDWVADWAERYDAVGISVEYRLAPEHPDPIPVEDCYAGLVWMVAHAAELGFDPERLIIAGASAGGGLAAGTALLARDRGGPALAGEILGIPMLDDRNETLSSRQYSRIGVWDRESNDFGWSALLGDRRGTEGVSIYAAPARATDLAGLPPTFIDVGSAEVFRDEAVAYAGAIWAAGGNAELHVWPGGFHGFELFVPQAAISRAARAAREAWLDRILGA